MKNKSFIAIVLIILTLIAISLFSSCSILSDKAFDKKAVRRGYAKIDSVTTSDTVVIIDTVSYDTLVISGDSVLLEAYFDCDSTNKVVIREKEQYKGQWLELQEKFENGHYSVKVVYKERKVLVPRFMRMIKQKQKAQTFVTVKVIPKFYKACGWIVIIEIIGFIFWLVWKFYARRWLKANVNLLR